MINYLSFLYEFLNECEHYNKSVWIEKERKNK